jgi:hypothetical protein
MAKESFAMAEVMWLKRDERPPDAPLALVDLDRSRGLPGLMDMVLHSSEAATFFVTAPYGEAERLTAIREAKQWADRQGIATVYVKP